MYSKDRSRRRRRPTLLKRCIRFFQALLLETVGALALLSLVFWLRSGDVHWPKWLIDQIEGTRQLWIEWHSDSDHALPDDAPGSRLAATARPTIFERIRSVAGNSQPFGN